jgi:hypothetical protein
VARRLVIATVVITIASGVDYFFGLRRLTREAEAARATGASPG